MKIASILSMPPEDHAALLPEMVTMISDMKGAEEPVLCDALIDGSFDVLVTDRALSVETLRAWSEARGGQVFVLIRRTRGQSRCFVSRCESGMQVFYCQHGIPIAEPFGLIERVFTREVTASETITMISRRTSRQGPETALIVGAGIVGLMTALDLIQAGYNVEVVEASHDPRTCPPWQSMGCTHGGANARMFSLTECDNYHDREVPEDGELHDYLRRRITDFGWLIGWPEAYCAEDAAWIRESMTMPVWMAEQYNDDIFAISHESLDYWRDLIDSTPELFTGVEFLEPLLRVASTADYNAKQLKRQKRVGAYRNDLEPDGVAEHYPALAAGVRNREIAGGIEVTGFTVNIHDYVIRLVDLLERRGVRFRWGTRATRIVRVSGIVTGVEIDGKVERRKHYFLSPGVYGADLLRGTATQGKVHGVLGAWINIPNLEPRLNVALKISRIGHIACSGNIIPARDAQGRPSLIFGSGFGYLGCDPANVDPDQIEALYVSMEDYLAAMFPLAFQQALDDGSLRQSRKYCVRPWTASGLGTFEVIPADSGLMVIASGHNTGGFAQSPAIGRATLDALQGRFNPMHILYHPRRFEAFWLDRKATVRPRPQLPVDAWFSDRKE